MVTSLINDTSPLLRTKEEIKEARELFMELNSRSLWSVAEAKRRRFTKAMLGYMRLEKRELDRDEERARSEARSRGSASNGFS